MKKVLLLATSLFLLNYIHAQDLIFLGNQLNESISRSDVNGNNSSEIVENQSALRRVRIDDVEGKVYWALPSMGLIRRSNFDGSNVEDVLSVSNDIAVIEIDEINGRIYFTENNSGTIKTCLIDGANPQVLVNGVGLVQGLAIDTINNHIYWTEFDNSTIRRVNFDGTNLQTILTTNDLLFDIQIDVENENLYFSNRTGNKIQRVKLDGTSLVTILNATGVIGAISLSLESQEIFWIENGADSGVFKSNLNGNAITNLINAPPSSFSGLDIGSSQNLSVNTSNFTFSQIYPNPTNGQLTIDLGGLHANVNIRVHNILGQEIFIQKEQSTSKITLDLNVDNGVYFINISTEDDQVLLKVIKD